MQNATDFLESKIAALRTLYDRCGYIQYKMSKFEEYDLYARNKDFLISDSVITFTDMSGKLMALKPDVTLSIVKNTQDADGTVQKLYYTENVYRVSKGTRAFRELTQVGLECIGAVDEYCLCEVLTLAAESLLAISDRAVLDVSDLGLLSDLIDRAAVPSDRREALLGFIGEKNLHELTALLQACGTEERYVTALRGLVSLSGKPETALASARELLAGLVDTASLDSLERLAHAVAAAGLGDVLRLDFSVVDDMHYYNGLVFKGFVEGLPSSVLTGGRYDKLMRKMHRRADAVGFAVYMDLLERLDDRQKPYDVDTVLLYGADASLEAIGNRVRELRAEGVSVTALQKLPPELRCRRVVQL